MTQAVEDGATRPVYYESRVIKLHLDKDTLALIDATYDALEQQSDTATIEKSKKMLGQMESVLGADSTVQSLCEDIVTHYEKYRANLLTGKAMIVAYSRPIAMKIYRKLLELRPAWKEKIGVVMTSGNNDPEDWKAIIGTKSHKEELARKFKDNDDPMKIAIVVDMWLTGFDVPSLATMYIYKPMHGYNLMQAIARVNRVFKDKEGGLIVDYVGIASALKAAMKEYTKRDQSRYGDMDISKVAYPKFQEKLQVCKDLLHGFDFSSFIDGSPLVMAKLVTGGVNFVLDAKAPKRKDLFLREAMLLKQSHSLCSSMTTEQERHEAAYMEAVRSTVVKITYGGSGGKTLSLKEINTQINELLKASIQSQGVISLFDSKQADENISLFDPAVLDEISKMKEKNIAVEILKKLMAEQVSLYKRTNVVQSQKFSEKIAQLMNSYYNGLITNEEVIKELLKTAQEITELYNNGKKLGLTQKELAFYDALTKPENIKDFYQNNELIDRIAEGLMVTVLHNAPIVMKDPTDYNARAELMWAGSLSHNGLTGTGRLGDFACHKMEHEIGGMFDVIHGAGLAAIWGSWARYVCKHDIGRFAQFAVRVMGCPMDYDNPENTALAGIEALENFYRRLDMPTNLRELGLADVTDAQIHEMAEKCTNGGKNRIGNFVPLGESDIEKIFKMAR